MRAELHYQTVGPCMGQKGGEGSLTSAVCTENVSKIKINGALKAFVALTVAIFKSNS